MQKETSSKLKENFKKMWPFVQPHWKRAVLAIVLTIPVGCMDAVIAWALKPYMDIVLLEKNLQASSFVPIIIIVFSMMQGGLNYASIYLNTWVGSKITHAIKERLFFKMLMLDQTFFDNSTSGSAVMRFNNDVDAASTGLLNHLRVFLSRIFASISLIAVLISASWELAIIAILFLIFALYPLSKIRKKIYSLSMKNVISNSQIITHYNEAFGGNKVIASYNLYDYQLSRFKKTLDTLFGLTVKMVQRTGSISPMMHVIVASGIASILWFGSYLIISGSMTTGGFISFITALLLLYQPIKSISNDYNAVEMSILSMQRVFALLEEKTKSGSCMSPVKFHIQKCIEFKNVIFEYKKGVPVLKNISLKIDAGTKVAFVGNSGGGKTTIVNLLPRFYDIKSGSIAIDGTNIMDINLTDLRSNISVVFQDNFLFEGTIAENILLGREDVSASALESAIKASCLEELIASLKDGLNTTVGERGVLLSGGQKQRIAIARAFIKNAPVVILDEATSALDNKSEEIVQKAIDNLMNDRTVLIIAHRLSTIRNVDRIVVINDGEVVENGTHEQLIKQNASYASLCKLQHKD